MRARLPLAGGALAVAAAGAIAWAAPPGVVLARSQDPQAEPDVLLAWLRRAGASGTVYATPRLGDYVAWRLATKVPVDVRPSVDGAPAVLDERLQPGEPGRYDALLLAFAPDGELRPDGACGPGFEIDRRAFALVAFDDAAMLWVRRDGPWGFLAASELRVLDPCAEPSARLLADGRWREVFVDDAERAFRKVPYCEICFAVRGVAELVSGGSAPQVFDGPHPVLRRMRDAAHLIAEALVAEASPRAAGGDVLGANAVLWRSILIHDTAAGRSALALQLSALGEVVAAIQHARRALALDPSSTEAQFALGMALYLNGERGEGAERLRAYVVANPAGRHAPDAVRLLAGDRRTAVPGSWPEGR